MRDEARPRDAVEGAIEWNLPQREAVDQIRAKFCKPT